MRRDRISIRLVKKVAGTVWPDLHAVDHLSMDDIPALPDSFKQPIEGPKPADAPPLPEGPGPWPRLSPEDARKANAEALASAKAKEDAPQGSGPWAPAGGKVPKVPKGMIPNRSWKEAQEGKTAGGEVMKRNQIGPGGQPVRPGDTVVASSEWAGKSQESKLETMAAERETLRELLTAAVGDDVDALRSIVSRIAAERGISAAEVFDQFRDGEGRGAAHLAAMSGSRDAVTLVANTGADISRADSHGHSPFFLACKHGHGDLARNLGQLLLGPRPPPASPRALCAPPCCSHARCGRGAHAPSRERKRVY